MEVGSAERIAADEDVQPRDMRIPIATPPMTRQRNPMAPNRNPIDKNVSRSLPPTGAMKSPPMKASATPASAVVSGAKPGVGVSLTEFCTHGVYAWDLHY